MRFDFQYIEKISVFTVLLICYVIYAIALTLEFQCIFTDDFYKNIYSGTENIEYVQTLISLNQNSILLNFIIAVFIVVIPAYAVAVCLWVGFSLIEKEVLFRESLKVSIWANLIFPINYLISVLLRISKILPYNEMNVDNNFRYQSILSVIKADVPDWLIYPLEKINMTELAFILLLGYFISNSLHYSMSASIGYAFLFYGCGLLLWIVFSVFLQVVLY